MQSINATQVGEIVGILGRFNLLTWAVKYFLISLKYIPYLNWAIMRELQIQVHNLHVGASCSKTGYLELGLKFNVNFPGVCSLALFFRNIV